MEHKNQKKIEFDALRKSSRVYKGLEELEINVRIETIWITLLLRLARILRKVPKVCKYVLSF